MELSGNMQTSNTHPLTPSSTFTLQTPLFDQAILNSLLQLIMFKRPMLSHSCWQCMIQADSLLGGIVESAVINNDDNFRIALKTSMNIQKKSLQLREDMVHIIKSLGGLHKFLQLSQDEKAVSKIIDMFSMPSDDGTESKSQFFGQS